MNAALPSLGALEISTVARGHFVGDEMIKAAPVRLLRAAPLSPGKFWILISGGVAEVEASLQMGRLAAGESLLDSLFLPGVHPGVSEALAGRCPPAREQALGIVETATASSGVRAADRALKTAPVLLYQLRLANGLGGKAYFTVGGEVSDVTAAVEAAEREAASVQQFVAREIIARPHPEFLRGVLGL